MLISAKDAALRLHRYDSKKDMRAWNAKDWAQYMSSRVEEDIFNSIERYSNSFCVNFEFDDGRVGVQRKAAAILAKQLNDAGYQNVKVEDATVHLHAQLRISGEF